METDIELVTKAAQTAELLCVDLRGIYRSNNLLLSEIAIPVLKAGNDLHTQLVRLQEALERMAERDLPETKNK